MVKYLLPHITCTREDKTTNYVCLQRAEARLFVPAAVFAQFDWPIDNLSSLEKLRAMLESNTMCIRAGVLT